MQLDVVNSENQKVGSVDVRDDVFGRRVNGDLIWESVVRANAAQRRGTHMTKNRALVSGSGKKPWRQKGTGRARAGSNRAAQWTGGGMAFPPQPKSYDLKVNRKARRAAFRSALSHHAQRGSLALIDGAAFGEPSTKAAAELVRSWGGDLPLLVVAFPEEEALIKSFRNLEKVLVLAPSELEVGAIVWARSVIATEAALARVQEVMAK